MGIQTLLQDTWKYKIDFTKQDLFFFSTYCVSDRDGSVGGSIVTTKQMFHVN